MKTVLSIAVQNYGINLNKMYNSVIIDGFLRSYCYHCIIIIRIFCKMICSYSIFEYDVYPY